LSTTQCQKSHVSPKRALYFRQNASNPATLQHMSKETYLPRKSSIPAYLVLRRCKPHQNKTRCNTLCGKPHKDLDAECVCCSVLQCVAVHCSVLQCVAVCCSVVQCGAVCCSALQCVHPLISECRPRGFCNVSVDKVKTMHTTVSPK